MFIQSDKSKRWRPRFRLSTLLLLMTLMAVLAAWMVDHRVMQTSLSIEHEQKRKLAIDLNRQKTSMRLQQAFWQMERSDLMGSNKARALRGIKDFLEKNQPVSEVVDETDTLGLEEQLSAAKDRVEALEKQIQLQETLRLYDVPTRRINDSPPG